MTKYWTTIIKSTISASITLTNSDGSHENHENEKHFNIPHWFTMRRSRKPHNIRSRTCKIWDIPVVDLGSPITVCESHCHITLSHHTVTSHCHNTLSHHTVTSHCHITLPHHTATSHYHITLSHHTVTSHCHATLSVTLASTRRQTCKNAIGGEVTLCDLVTWP